MRASYFCCLFCFVGTCSAICSSTGAVLNSPRKACAAESVACAHQHDNTLWALHMSLAAARRPEAACSARFTQ